MQERMKISQNGLNLTMSEEQLRLVPYNDPDGFATVGYGHLIRRGPVEPTDQPITVEQAQAYLAEDFVVPENVIFNKVVPQLNQNQFDALADFVYNEGSGNFERSSLLQYINDNKCYDPVRIQLLFNAYVYAGGRRLEGLATRRQKEAQLFNTPV